MLKIPTDGNKHLEFQVFDFDNGQSTGNLRANNLQLDLSIAYNLQLPTNGINHDGYKVYILYSNRFNKENDIFQIIDKAQNKRIGWVYPIQSIISLQHDQAQNKHFLNYSFAAFCNLLSGNFNIENGFNHLKSAPFPFPDEPLQLNDVFSDDLIIACLSKSTLPQDFDFEMYLLSLYEQGYYFNRKPNRVSVEKIIERPKVTLSIYPICQALKDDFYIKEIFRNYLLDSSNELFRFHLLYQIIELFIDKIFDSEFQKLVVKNYQPREFSEKINRLSNESHRISVLFNQYTYIDRLLVYDFKVVLNDFLSHFQLKKGNIWEGLYKARNIMVHKYREAIELRKPIVTINDMFEEIIIEAILSYKDKIVTDEEVEIA